MILTEREKWLMKKAWENARCEHEDVFFEKWLDSSAAEAVTVEIIIEKEAPITTIPPEVLKVFELVTTWLEAALGCEGFKWDVDQHEAAECCAKLARKILPTLS